GDVVRFWGRRVRRLIPAACLVLTATVVAAAVWLPATVRRAAALDGVAASLYVENWRLAVSEADYLEAESLASSMQHYWSLSIEEQFYIVWPIVLGLATAVAVVATRRSGRDRRALAALVTIAATVAVSLAWSAHYTKTNPAQAYFVSTTRVWELALGGLLAAVLAVAATGTTPRRAWRHGRVVRAAVAWAGLVCIGVAAFWYDGATVFPGVAALLPTVGTLVVIAAAADGVRGGPGPVLGLRPVQWVGDVSYSIYLWHWPLIAIVPFALGRGLRIIDTFAILAATLVLAAFTRHFVEDLVRWHPKLTTNLRATFAMGAACMLVVCVAAAGLLWATSRGSHDPLTVHDAVAHAAPCVGAGVVRDSSCAEPALLTPPVFSAGDKPVVYADRCWNNTPFTSRNVCSYGVTTTPAARIAIVGNSHAGHWIPALGDALGDNGWELTTYLQSVCYPVDELIRFPGEGASANCRELNHWLVSSVITSGADLVIMSARTNYPIIDVATEDQQQVAEEAYRTTLATFTDAGIPVLVIRDTPALSFNAPDCVAQHPNDPAACGDDRAAVLPPDPLAAAAAADTSGMVTLLDLTDLLCDAQTCPAVVGGVIVYFDKHHLSATFVRTLAPEIVPAVVAALAHQST
ncbi:MAG: acyltransferase, partial [Micrococcales bacterium]|nr:acyltransferase [Micrococcales bacterium]